MKITRTSVTAATKYVKAAEEDEYDELNDTEGIIDAIDDVADNIEDIQNDIEDVDEDSVDIALNNNIANHYIAECEKCQGIFISAVVESDQDIEYVSGICPVCNKETNQYLKWVIRDISEPEGQQH